MLQLDKEGRMTPFATGFRSPSSFGYNLEGDLFYSENQGDWVGTGHVTHVEKGDFVGNPKGLKWSGEPGSGVTLTVSDIPDTGEPKYEVAKRVPHLKTPAVWFPHTIMGISTSAILVDSTRGAFGPFAGQLFVGDQGQSKIMRVYLEKVNGVYQGIVVPFREGFASGVFRQVWGKDGSMYVGQTSRGWGATGRAPYALQRLVWTGKTPFEPQKVEARPDGFEISFTMPVDRAAAADPASYKVSRFTYKYHHIYGSPVINQAAHQIRSVVVSRDGRSARLVIDSLRQGYIHEIRMAGVKSESGAPLLHDFGYYTVNQIPGGAKLAVRSAPARQAAATTSAGASSNATTNAPAGAPLAKRQTTMPAQWAGKVDQTVSVTAEEGLKFNVTNFTVKAGSRVKLDFANPSDMLHNLVIVRPGTATKVGEDALKLGLDGMRLNYVPPTSDVVHYTKLLEPEKAESIYFEAPTTPGEYPYICSFPGHWVTMVGTMRVTR
jgi:azurin